MHWNSYGRRGPLLYLAPRCRTIVSIPSGPPTTVRRATGNTEPDRLNFMHDITRIYTESVFVTEWCKLADSIHLIYNVTFLLPVERTVSCSNSAQRYGP